MQDPDTPPQGEENTNGAEDGDRQDEAREAPWVACAKTSKGSLPRPCNTAIGLISMGTMATRDNADPDFRAPMPLPIPSLCPLRGKMRHRAFSHLSKASSSSARFRTRAAR